VIAVEQPGAVVGGEDHQCVVFQAVRFDRVENLPDRPINFFQHVAIKSARRFALEFVRDVQRHMRHVVRHFQKERPILVTRDE